MPEHKRLIVVIPGIGGSSLREPRTGKTVWSHGHLNLLKVLADPGRISVDEHPRLEPTGLLQDIQLVPGWTVVNGYTSLWDRLAARPGAVADRGHPDRRVEAATLVAFGYDFRLGIRDAAQRLADEVSRRFHELGWHGRRAHRSVVVVAHSLGGLVARYWVGALGGDAYCDTLVTLGTPHRGAPKALDVLANGVHLPVTGSPLNSLSRAVQGWDSVAELLPRYPCVAHPRDADRGMYVHELAAENGAFEALSVRAAHGWDLHREIERCWAALSDPPTVRPRIGFGQRTLSSARLSPSGRIEVDDTPPVWCDLGNYATELGDATVPAISALPVEMDGQDPTGFRVRSTHGALTDDEAAVSTIDWLEGRWHATAARGSSDDGTALGLDIEDVYPSGTPIAVDVRLHGGGSATSHPETLRLRAVPRDCGDPSASVVVGSPVWNAERQMFEARLPALGVGLWTITADTTGQGRPLVVSRGVAVL